MAIVALMLVGLPARARADTALSLVADAVVDGSAGRLHDLTVASPALGTTAHVRVLLPPGYDSTDQRYPLVLLLHGASGSSADWTNKTDLVSQPDAEGLIVVMPDGGANGFYSDWEHGPQWETFHIRELLPWVAATYRTIADREHTAVVGNSMGGFGAMAYAARHPELFAAATSFSGFLDNSFGGPGEELVLHQLGYVTDDLWGPYSTDEVTWRDHNPPDLDGNLRWTRLVAWTGDGVPAPGDNPATGTLEAGVLLLNTSFHDRLVKDGVAHDYRVFTPGTHAWQYWQARLHEALPAIVATFADPPARPDAWDYRSAEPSFSAWRWSFTVDRSVKAPVQLQQVSAAGLTATGDGTLHVVTDALFEPGATYRVEGPAGASQATADDQGRLAFAVGLTGGPAAWTIAFVAGPAPAAGHEAATAATAVAGVDQLPATGSDVPVDLAALLVVVALAGRAGARRRLRA